MSEREHLRTLGPYSRMALFVRGWGLESLLGFGLALLWRITSAAGGEGLTVLVFGGLGIGVRRLPALHHWLSRTLRDRSTRRWFNRVLVACEVISRRGQLPRVEATEVIPAGRRLRLRLPAGFDAEQITQAAEPLAATMGVREVRVLRDAANASLAHLSIISSDPLSISRSGVAEATGLVVGSPRPWHRRGRQGRVDRTA